MTVSTPLLERLLSPIPVACEAGGDPQRGAGGELASLCVDLGLLFNATGLAALRPLRAQSHSARSVLNYGLGNLAGVLLSSLDIARLERRIRDTLLDFEPRILRHSLAVRMLAPEHCSSHLHVLIEGEIRAPERPRAFALKSTWSTESGEVRVRPWGRSERHG